MDHSDHAPLDHSGVEALFTRRDGGFRFARWARPLAPAIVGTDDQGCRIFEGAIEAVAGLAGLGVTDLDPDLGANFLVFIVNDWAELHEAPNLVRLIPNLADLVQALTDHDANQYRVFNFELDGAIRLCITLLRYDAELQSVPAQTVAVGQALQGLLLWSDAAFMGISPLALTDDGLCIVKPEIVAVLRAAYDPGLPNAGQDASLALRLAARIAVAANAEPR